ncbi:hypothetical protein AB6A40_002395 [Gnathostoma spinigerum]|uniref:Core Histone H2A/H2B/H3 domain-containing protein n=1 Tax=Gnathostoma spinigerum TaxID=75299 RepID=A0ABD6EE72_9BILA
MVRIKPLATKRDLILKPLDGFQNESSAADDMSDDNRTALSVVSGSVVGGGKRRVTSKKAFLYGSKRKRQTHKPGAKIAMEIRRLRNSVHLLIPRAPFFRVVREVVYEMSGSRGVNRFTLYALEALHEATEAFLVRLFECAQLCADHARRVTLMPRDMQLVRRLRSMAETCKR